MPSSGSLLALLFLVSSLSADSVGQTQSPGPKPSPEVVTSDCSRTTPGGATFIVPAAWSITSGPPSVTLQPPEPDTHLAILDVHAADAATAVAHAWAAYQPGMKRPQAADRTGEDETYGMGLETNRRWGVHVIHHGGSLFGYKSDWMILPDSGIGAVLLTNADNGGMLLRPVMHRLLEVVFDGKPEAVGDVDSAASNHRAYIAKERQRLTVPASPDEVSRLAADYSNAALGDLKVEHEGANTLFSFGEWKSTVASRKNDDGTISFITIDPTRIGFEFVKSERDGKRVLVIRGAQHECVFREVSAE